MSDFRVDSRELVQQVWDEVAIEQAIAVESELEPLPEFEPMVHDEERQYINAHVLLDRAPAPSGTGRWRRGIRARLASRAANFVFLVLERYLDDEREFMAHLVRLQNKLTSRHDRLSEEVRSVYLALQRETARARQANAALHTSLEDRVSTLERQLENLEVLAVERKD